MESNGNHLPKFVQFLKKRVIIFNFEPGSTPSSLRVKQIETMSPEAKTAWGSSYPECRQCPNGLVLYMYLHYYILYHGTVGSVFVDQVQVGQDKQGSGVQQLQDDSCRTYI